jgi:uncharacterized membrane protein
MNLSSNQKGKAKMAEDFWELLQSSTLIQGIVTLVLVITFCVQVILGHPVSSEFVGIVTLCLGFWFGQKTQQQIQANASKGV